MFDPPSHFLLGCDQFSMAFLEEMSALSPQLWISFSLILLGIKLLVNKYFCGLNAIPGPFAAGFTNLWRVSNTLFSNPTETLVQLHRRFDSYFVRLGPNVVSVSDPSLIPTIYGVNTDFKKTDFYSIIDLWHEGKFQHSLFESRDEEYHARIRRPIANAYSMTAVMEFEPAVDSTIELLRSKLDQFVLSNRPFKLEKWLQYYTFDVL
jgi:hypothetical protein